MSLEKLIALRGIEEVVHFTTNRGLVGTLAKGQLLSRPLLKADELLSEVAYPNTKFRQEDSDYFNKDEEWINFVNMSLSLPNIDFFNKSRTWHLNGDVYWVVLSFSAEVLLHDRVFFTSTNNVYKECIRAPGAEGLENLFAERVHRRDDWWAYRRTQASHITTCPQAEVLYWELLGTEYLKRVYVANKADAIRANSSLKEYDRPDVEVRISPQHFGIYTPIRPTSP